MSKGYYLKKDGGKCFMVKHISVLMFVLVLVFSVIYTIKASASEIQEIKNKIENTNSQIQGLEKEIKQYQEQLNAVGQEAKTLQNAVQTLDLTQKKLGTDIKLTENRIGNTSLSIEQLSAEIENSEENIEVSREIIRDTLRKINENEEKSLIETFLSYNNIAILWDDIETLQRFQAGIKDKVNELKITKTELEMKKQETEEKKQELLMFKTKLSDQQKIVDNNKKEKNNLLSVTKNQEANYKKILDEKKALYEAFQRELNEYESRLRIAIDPNSLPPAGKGVLAWPLDSIRVTQYFGHTEFAKTTSAYNGKGHNGVDFGASRGTPVKSAGSGIVEGTGNTDAIPGCFSYGKWVLIKHNNGLSTLYAHLDLIKVIPGQKVTVKDVIGYSGNTGYSTGPHLHFGVYASQGVQIIKYTQSINCKNATIPIASTNAYLNPLLYL